MPGRREFAESVYQRMPAYIAASVAELIDEGGVN